MDPITISAIVMGATSLVAVTGKLLHTFRRNIKSCFGVQFRSLTPPNGIPTPHNTPENIDIQAINNDAQMHNVHQRTKTIYPQYTRERLQSEVYFNHDEYDENTNKINSVQC